MNFYALPQKMYQMEGITQILSYKNNAILHKKLQSDVIDAETLTVSHVLVYVAEGKAQVNTYEGDEIYMQKGDMLFMPRDSYVVSDYISEGKDVEVFLVFFDDTIVDKLLKTYRPKDNIDIALRSFKASKSVITYLEDLQTLKIDNRHDKALIELKLLEFLDLVMIDKDMLLDVLHASKRQKLERDITEFMNVHFEKRLSVKDYALLSGRSLSTFTRVFKHKYNQTPKQWLIQKRVEKAQQLLEQSMSVTDTAFEVGYQNVSHFIAAYKSIYTQTPKKMQQEL